MKWQLWSKVEPKKKGAYWIYGYWPRGYYDWQGKPCDRNNKTAVLESDCVANLSLLQIDDLELYKGKKIVNWHSYSAKNTLWWGPIPVPKLPARIETL